jgi:hypothetical protein
VDYKSLEIKNLEDRHKISMLIYLLKEGKSKKSQIYDNMPRNSNCPAKLNELESMGLVSYDKHALNNVTFVELTETGKVIAKNLLNVQDILSGEIIIDSDPDMDNLSSEKRDLTSSESISHSVSTSVQSPTFIKILVAVQNNPGITMGELTDVFGKGDLRNTIHDAENEKYIFECDMGRSDGKSGYHITVKGVDLIGSRAFAKNVGDVVEMDCNASSKQENKVGW